MTPLDGPDGLVAAGGIVLETVITAGVESDVLVGLRMIVVVNVVLA
jgi:hypothetical protein